MRTPLTLALLGVSLGWTVLGSAAPSEASDPRTLPPPTVSIEEFIDQMAVNHGFDAADLSGLFGHVRVRTRILEIFDRPSGRGTWSGYRARFVNPERIQGGLRFWSEHAEMLARAQETFGVPEETIAAIIGIETQYGENTGSFGVLEALTTLAFNYPRRAEQFRGELEHYLLLTREEGMGPLSMKGSYAGAMGIAQFMPGSYRNYGIDFDGDGRKDLVGNMADAIGSVANYLKEFGWQPQQPVVVRARVEGDLYPLLLKGGLDAYYYLTAMERLGVTPRETLPGHFEGRLIELDTAEGRQHWLGMKNFYVLTRYNRSTYYAMAVHQLGQEIRERREEATAR